MAKIPFNIKYRQQIESGEYKVETRDGLPVRIICWDRLPKKHYDDDLNLCVLVPDDEGEALYYYHCSGKRWVPNDGYDLFIVTPKPELTEWQRLISACLQKHGLLDCGAADRIAKESAAKLLDLAKKEIEEELKEKVLHDYWKQASDQCVQARKEAKAEAMKDLPRWKKWGNGAGGNGRGIPIALVVRGLNGYEIVDALGIQGEKYIMLSDLEKLPGFKED